MREIFEAMGKDRSTWGVSATVGALLGAPVERLWEASDLIALDGFPRDICEIDVAGHFEFK